MNTDASNWLEAVRTNNPDGKRIELNPECDKWLSKLHVNNPLAPNACYNPIDFVHPLGIDWFLLWVKREFKR